MYQPHAHHVLIFLGTFLALWSISLIARGLLHRPRVGPPPAVGPRKVKRAAVAAGAFGFPVGVAVVAAGFYLRYWIYGPNADPSGLTAFHALAAGIIAFASALAAWGLFADRAKRTLRCPKCWYDMAGVASTGRLTCPECGHNAKTTSQLQRTRRHWKLVTLAAFIALAGLMAPRFANISKGGIKSVLPTTLFISAYWRLPDSWVRNTNADDEWTMDQRLEEPNSWKWQRDWFASQIRSEVRAPTKFSRFERALQREGTVFMFGDGVFGAESYTFAARQLGSPDVKIRWRAAALFRRSFAQSGWKEGHRDVFQSIQRLAAPQIVLHADEISQGLADESFTVVLQTFHVLLAAKANLKQVVDAILALYPTLIGTEEIITSSFVLIETGWHDERAIDAILLRSEDPNAAVAKYVWDAISMQSTVTPVHHRLLERTDRELREGTDNDRYSSAAVIRLAGPNADASLAANILSVASSPGPMRAGAIRALSYCDQATSNFAFGNSHTPLLHSALADPDPKVIDASLLWLNVLVWNSQMTCQQFLPDLEPLAVHPDDKIQSLAKVTTARIKQALELQREASKAKPSIQPESLNR